MPTKTGMQILHVAAKVAEETAANFPSILRWIKIDWDEAVLHGDFETYDYDMDKIMSVLAHQNHGLKN